MIETRIVGLRGNGAVRCATQIKYAGHEAAENTPKGKTSSRPVRSTQDLQRDVPERGNSFDVSV